MRWENYQWEEEGVYLDSINVGGVFCFSNCEAVFMVVSKRKSYLTVRLVDISQEGIWLLKMMRSNLVLGSEYRYPILFARGAKVFQESKKYKVR